MKTVDELQADLARIEQKLQRNRAEYDSVSGERLNPIGEIGGIRSRSKKRKRQIADKRLRVAKEYVELITERQQLQREIKAAQQRPVHEKAQATIEQVLRDKLRPGDRVETQYGEATVIRCNAKSVTIETGSGFRDRLGWNQLRPVDWQRMYAEWRADNE